MTGKAAVKPGQPLAPPAKPGETFTPKHGHGKLRRPGWNRGIPIGGRHVEWVTQLAYQILDQRKLLDVLGQIGAGEVPDQLEVEGKVMDIPAKLHDRIRAIELLLAYAVGRPRVSVEVTSEIAHRIVEVVPTLSVSQWTAKYLGPVPNKEEEPNAR